MPVCFPYSQLLPFLYPGRMGGGRWGAGRLLWRGGKGREGERRVAGWMCPAQGQASLCGHRVTRWSGSSAGHDANFPPLLPSTDKPINPGLLWAFAALNLWAFTAYCFVGLICLQGEAHCVHAERERSSN